MIDIISPLLWLFIGIIIGLVTAKKASNERLYRAKLEGLRIGRKENRRQR